MCNFVPLPHLSQWGVVKNLLKIVETESLLLWDPEPIKNGPALHHWLCCEISAGTYITATFSLPLFQDSNVPKCSSLNAFVKNHFPLSDFNALE